MKLDFEKLVQVLNYFAINQHGNGKTISKLDALKLVFLVDRYHLRKYARPVTGDEYWAMDLGPVPSMAKTICDSMGSLEPSEIAYASKYLSPSKDGKKLRSNEKYDPKVFSETDMEALKHVLDISRNIPSLPDYTHIFPEWKKYESALMSSPREKMNPDDFFLPYPEKNDYCPANSEQVRLCQELYHENTEMESMIF